MKLITWIAGGCTCGAPLAVPELRPKYKGGTDIIINVSCTNSLCKKVLSWHSTSCVGDTQYRSGNVDLASAILVSGASRQKVIRLLKMMGAMVFSVSTYDALQTDYIIPAVNEYYDEMMYGALKKRKEDGKSLYVSGDARHDSPGISFY